MKSATSADTSTAVRHHHQGGGRHRHEVPRHRTTLDALPPRAVRPHGGAQVQAVASTIIAMKTSATSAMTVSVRGAHHHDAMSRKMSKSINTGTITTIMDAARTFATRDVRLAPQQAEIPACDRP